MCCMSVGLGTWTRKSLFSGSMYLQLYAKYSWSVSERQHFQHNTDSYFTEADKKVRKPDLKMSSLLSSLWRLMCWLMSRRRKFQKWIVDVRRISQYCFWNSLYLLYYKVPQFCLRLYILANFQLDSTVKVLTSCHVGCFIPSEKLLGHPVFVLHAFLEPNTQTAHMPRRI